MCENPKGRGRSDCFLSISNGLPISEAIQQAVSLSARLGGRRVVIEVDGVTVRVRRDSDQGLLERDFLSAKEGLIGKKVGPYPSPYD